MCPACLASIAITVATATGAGTAVTSAMLRVKRSWIGASGLDPEEEGHERVETQSEDRSRVRPAG